MNYHPSTFFILFLLTNIRELSFFLPGVPSICGGDQNCLGWSNGEPVFFHLVKGGGREFLRGPRGGTRIFFKRGAELRYGRASPGTCSGQNGQVRE